MLRNLDTIYYKPDLVRISQPKLISARTFFWSTEVGVIWGAQWRRESSDQMGGSVGGNSDITILSILAAM